MEPRQRVKKAEPERTQPIRNWWTVFGAPGVSTPPGDPVTRGVQMGYRVIEEYLRQGQSVARMMWSPVPGSMPADTGTQQSMGAMLQSLSDCASLWLQRMGGAPGFAPASGQAGPFSTGEGAATPPPPAPQARSPGSVGFTVVLESRRHTEISLDLRPCSSGLPLRILDLRAPEPDKPCLTEVTIERVSAEERVALRLRIPEDQPAGIYSGVILEEQSGLPRGTLCVRVAPA